MKTFTVPEISPKVAQGHTALSSFTSLSGLSIRDRKSRLPGALIFGQNRWNALEDWGL